MDIDVLGDHGEGVGRGEGGEDVAALPAYDMVKGVERGVEIRSVRLVSQSGGQSGEWHRPADAGAGPGAQARPSRRPGERVAGRIRKKP